MLYFTLENNIFYQSFFSLVEINEKKKHKLYILSEKN